MNGELLFARKARVEMLPLVDVIFLLLIFFIYSMVTMGSQWGIGLKLPKAILSGRTEHSTIVLSIDRNNALYLNSKSVLLLDLGAKIGPLIKAQDSYRVFIEGHKDSSLDATIQVIDALKRIGVRDVTFGCQKAGGL